MVKTKLVFFVVLSIIIHVATPDSCNDSCCCQTTCVRRTACRTCDCPDRARTNPSPLPVPVPITSPQQPHESNHNENITITNTVHNLNKIVVPIQVSSSILNNVHVPCGNCGRSHPPTSPPPVTSEIIIVPIPCNECPKLPPDQVYKCLSNCVEETTTTTTTSSPLVPEKPCGFCLLLPVNQRNVCLFYCLNGPAPCGSPQEPPRNFGLCPQAPCARGGGNPWGYP